MMNPNLLLLKRPWWQVSLLLLVCVLLVSQGAQAQTDYKTSYPFMENPTYDSGGQYIKWSTVLFNDLKADEGFFESSTYGWGCGVHMKAGNDSYKYAGNLCCNSTGGNQRMYNIYSNQTLNSSSWTENSYDKFYGGSFKFDSGTGTDGSGNITWIRTYWKIPFDLLNTDITVRMWGTWSYWTSTYGTNTDVDVTKTVACPYTFTVRQIDYNGSYNVTPDGTVTIPYKFSGSGNTDGHNTTICTAINGTWSGKIGYRYPSSNYSNGSYTFKLSDIGKNLRSDFNIETYHEYKHYNDRDAGGGTKVYTTSAGTIKFAGMPVANITSGKFNQSDKSVTLYWTADNSNFQQGNWGTKWVIYRDGVKIGTVLQNEANNANFTGGRSYYFVDTQNIGTEKNYKYTIYYVWKDWDESTQLSDLKSNEVTVNTSRSVPINALTADSQSDKIVFSWTSDAYEAGWCTFNIYVDNETSPIYSITPTANQTSYTWQHRYKDIDGRQNGSGFTEERLNGCDPHKYRIEGVIGGSTQNWVTVNNVAIGTKTRFVSFKATKGVYAGTVKLSWQVLQEDEDKAKTYIVDRRTAEKENEAWTTIYRTASNDEYMFYTDETALPGIYYDYRVTVQDKCDNGNVISSETTDVGFALATGTVSGRITYGTTGMAVKDADVVAEKTGSSGADLEQFHSMYFNSTDGYVKWQYPKNTYSYDVYYNKDFTIQMWIKPEEFKIKEFIYFNLSFRFWLNESGQLFFSRYSSVRPNILPTGATNLGITLKKGVYNHLVIARTGNVVTTYLIEPVENGDPIVNKATTSIGNGTSSGTAGAFSIGRFKGYLDEFRMWKRCLTKSEILENYDRLLVGNEKDLDVYWTFDEGLTKQFFDYSREGTTYHEHHGTIGNNTQPDTHTPSALKLKAKTDDDGNYIIMGVPFSGEGTTYAIKPSLGVHDFNPQQHLRYVGNNSLVHNGVDFDDVSSFKVSGHVYYEHTTIPVKDAYLYIDGVMASRDGEPVMTNSEGKYEISVPIGDHFIQVKMQGHTFLNAGRYPNDPNGTGLRHTFDSEIDELTFYDQTLVTVAGRVAGGDIEYEKPLGLNQGKNNIGKAILHLGLDSDRYWLNLAEPDPDDPTPSNKISSQDRVFLTEYGTAKVPGDQNYIEIETDPTTGEWVAQLPPLRYNIDYVSIPSRPSSDVINTQSFSLPIIDATNVNVTYTDSVEVDGSYQYFEYVASSKLKYKSQSTIEVTENKDGSFGMKNYKVTDIGGNEHDIPLYTVDNNGKVQYSFGVTDQNPDGYPVYQELSTYKYNLYAYENYTNYDNNPNDPVSVKVPLAGKTVTIKNQFASTTSVRQDNGEYVEIVNDKLELDDNGKAVYKFTVGFPNIQEPYTRGLSISYDNNGTEMPWDGNGKFKVIVIGGLPTGNNFVTQGPDEVLMVLRDPPGTNSKATWSKGTTVTKTTTTTSEYNNKTALNSTIYCGVETSTAAGFGVMVITDLESKFNIEAGAEYTAQRTSGNTKVSKTTTTQEISTKDNIDFVGACGDLFIGTSKNLIFGACRTVDIKWNNVTGEAELVQEDALSTGEEFTTSFAYEENNVKNVVIPNFKDLRNSLLTPVASVSQAARPEKGSKNATYVTTLSKDDPRYGSSNDDTEVWGSQAVPFDQLENGIYSGPSYTMLLPIDYETDPDLKGIQDMVKHYNTQIKKWEDELSKNEQAKVTAMSDRRKYLDENLSFSAGANVTRTVEIEDGETMKTSTTDGFNIVLGLETGFRFSGVGIGVKLNEENGGSWTSEVEDETTTNASISYELSEDGDDDYLSVDVYNAPDGFGPIFVTRGGATSCPYEDEVVTEYFQPGTVISKKTVQIEKPEIEVQNQIITGIPAGGSGNFKVNIRNNSDTGEDLWFDIYVPPYSNPNGLSVMMDDASLNKGTTVLVRAGEVLEKTITIKQTVLDTLDYENVQIKLASQCQKDNTSTYAEISSTTEFSAHFQPTCSDIILKTSHYIVNADTQDMLTLSMSGYNYSSGSLKGIRLQYKGENDADFHTLKEWMKNPGQNQEQLISLVGTQTLNYTFDLRTADYDDKTYIFRAITVCDQGGVEVYNESDEIPVIRDMSRPQLIASPSPVSGILNSGSDLLITFNEDIQNSAMSNLTNFDVVGELNEREVAHDVALSLTGMNAAKTEATINLSGNSFSASMWVNYQTDGTLLMHGTKDNSFTVAIENSKLAVSVAGQKAVSTATLPKDKWLYLNVSYEADDTTPIVNAAYAEGANTVTLLNGAAVKAYEGNGAVSLGGNNLTAKVQELSIWNSGRSIDEATADMYTTKSQYTNGLLGYWQFDEGHGSMATDKARNRHITLPSQNAWWINGDNYAMPLDGTKTMAVNIGNLNTTSSEDYLVETWFKADAQQNGIASVLSTNKMDLRLNAQGQMELLLGNVGDATANNTTMVYNKDLRDGQWHHLAVSALKSTGGGNIYIDGQQYKQIAASVMPELFGDKLLLGGRRLQTSQAVYTYTEQLKGAVDEVRIWKGRRTASVIKDNMYARVKADEAGLVAYYPMEKNTRDAYNQIVAVGTLANSVVSGSAADELTFYKSNGTTYGSQLSTLSSANTAALKQAPRKENVQFSFVASERQIKVNLEEAPARLEGCNVYITVKNVKDLHGNKAEPITWGVYVQQNNLRWEEPEMSVVKKAGEKTTFTATIENRSSENESWSLSGLPSWLTVNTEGGVLKPLSNGTLTFSISESLSAGKYETTFYLTGNQNIAAPLTVNVKSKGDEPLWSVNPGDFEESMNVIGELRILDVTSRDEDDIVAAFIGNECRGVARPKYDSRYDGYFVTMDIYGNSTADDGKPIEFKAYDASSGIIYPVVKAYKYNETQATALTFEPGMVSGRNSKPMTLAATDDIEQNIELNSGWNWMSLSVKPTPMTVATVFAKADGKVNTVKSLKNVTGCDNGSWVGDFAMYNTDMYAVNATEALTLSVTGQRVNTSETPITVAEGWNWIGYCGQALISVGEALAGLNPQDGDIIKGQKGVAYYEDNAWSGSLETLVPGKGYKLQSATGGRSFTYPTTAAASRMYKEADLNGESRATGTFTPVDYSSYPANMVLIAKVVKNGMPVNGAELGVFAGSVCREAAVTDGQGMVYITIPGDKAEKLTFRVAEDEFVLKANESVNYKTDAVIGTPRTPFFIELGTATAVGSVATESQQTEQVFDLQGRKVKVDDQTRKLRKGVYIVNGQKQVK